VRSLLPPSVPGFTPSTAPADCSSRRMDGKRSDWHLAPAKVRSSSKRSHAERAGNSVESGAGYGDPVLSTAPGCAIFSARRQRQVNPNPVSGRSSMVRMGNAANGNLKVRSQAVRSRVVGWSRPIRRKDGKMAPRFHPRLPEYAVTSGPNHREACKMESFSIPTTPQLNDKGLPNRAKSGARSQAATRI